MKTSAAKKSHLVWRTVPSSYHYISTVYAKKYHPCKKKGSCPRVPSPHPLALLLNFFFNGRFFLYISWFPALCSWHIFPPFSIHTTSSSYSFAFIHLSIDQITTKKTWSKEKSLVRRQQQPADKKPESSDSFALPSLCQLYDQHNNYQSNNYNLKRIKQI